MYVVNFSHPLTHEQIEEIATTLGQSFSVLQVDIHIDRSIPVSEHAVRIVDSVALTPQQWQTEQMVIIPPGLAILACTLLVEIHGRCGYFVPMLEFRPVANAVPPRFEFHCVIDLFAQREQARQRRQV